MIYIKRLFPGINYLMRKVKVISNKQVISKIGQDEVVEIPAEGDTLTFKIDYHKTTIQIPDTNTDTFISYTLISEKISLSITLI